MTRLCSATAAIGLAAFVALRPAALGGVGQSTAIQLEGDLSVRDRAGRAVGGLPMDQFDIRLNGEPVAWRFASPRVRDFILLLDYSTSMYGGRALQGQATSDGQVTSQCLSWIADTTWMSLLGKAMAPGDRSRVASFGSSGKVAKFTSTAADFETTLRDVHQPGGPSPLWDALYGLPDFLDRLSRGRPIALLVTDGFATADQRSFAEAVARVASSPLTIYTTADRCGLDFAEDDTALSPRQALSEVARATGGRLLETAKGVRPANVMDQLLDDLAKHYRIEVTIPAAATERPAVRTIRPNTQVVARWSR
jgi:hypothetical protein